MEEHRTGLMDTCKAQTHRPKNVCNSFVIAIYKGRLENIGYILKRGDIYI